MDGLIIKQPYASLIITGQKDWELRSRKPPKNKLNKRIYLLSEGHAVGIIKITGCRGPLTMKELRASKDRHLGTIDFSDPSYAWIIKVVEHFPSAFRYMHPRGARVWVNGVELRRESPNLDSDKMAT